MRGGLLLAALAASLVAAGGVLAAPPEDRIVPADQHSSEKARSLAAKYLNALRELNAGIYHCVPWVEIGRESIGFFRPKHLPGDDRYLSLRIYVEQDPSPQFAALRFEERAAAMFSRYVGGMLRRMAAHAAVLADPALDGFTVIVGWLKQVAQRDFAVVQGEETPSLAKVRVVASTPMTPVLVSPTAGLTPGSSATTGTSMAARIASAAAAVAVLQAITNAFAPRATSASAINTPRSRRKVSGRSP